MNLPRQSLRIGGLAILFALLLRLSGSGLVQQVSELLSQPTIASWIIYLETGHIVRFSPSFPDMEVFSMASHAPEIPELTPLPVFSPSEADDISVKTNSSLQPDLFIHGDSRIHIHATAPVTVKAGKNSFTYDPATGILRKTENTVSIHWYSAAWLSPWRRLRTRIMRSLHRIFGVDAFKRFRK